MIHRELSGQTVNNQDSGKSIYFNKGKDGVRQAVKGSRNTQVSQGLTQLRPIVTNAIYANVSEVADASGRSAQKQEKSANTQAYHWFIQPVEIGDRHYIAWFNARQHIKFNALIFDSFGMAQFAKEPEAAASRNSIQNQSEIDSLTSASGGITIREMLNHVKGEIQKQLPSTGSFEEKPTEKNSSTDAQGKTDNTSFSIAPSSPERDARNIEPLVISSEALPGGKRDWHKAVRDYIAENLVGKTLINQDTGKEIKFTSLSKREAPSKLRREPAFRATKEIGTITEEAIHLGFSNNSKPGQKSAERFDYFALPVEIDGQRAVAWFNALRPQGEQHSVFYEFGLSQTKKPQASRTHQKLTKANNWAQSLRPQKR